MTSSTSPSSLATRWIAAGLLANLDEFTGDANLTPAEWNPKDFVDGAQVPYRDAKGATYGYSWEGGAMLMGLSRMDLMEKKGLKIPKTFAELQQVCAEINGTDGVNGMVSWFTPSLESAALHPGLWRQHLQESARRYHAGAEYAARPSRASSSTRTC